MAAELYTLSFLCVIFLVVFIPVRRVRMSVPHLAILLWLSVVNLIRGINALVWDGNVDERAPVWCDIATKFMLGSNVALPAICLCISRHLELLGSSRSFMIDNKAARNRRLLELFLCYVVPVIYVGLQPVSQDHRFDLVKDYGCSPSIHNSSLPLALIWIPPLILCGITLMFSCYAFHHTSRISYPQFIVHLDSRTNMTASIFFRELSTSFLMTAALIIVIAFSVFSGPALVPWSSWDAVHSQLWKVNVVTNPDVLNTKRLEWWLFFAVSLLYILLLFTIGEEARDAFRWVVPQLKKKRQFPKLQNLQLPLFTSHKRSRGEAAGGSSSNLMSRYPSPLPLTLEFRSGWDEMLDNKTNRWKFLPRKGTPSPSPPSPTPSSSNTDEDKAFMASTLSYLGSRTARSLGISSPPPIRPTSFTPPLPSREILTQSQPVLEIPSLPTSPPPPPPHVFITPPSILPYKTKPVRTDVPPEDIGIPLISTSAPGVVVASPVRTSLLPDNMSTVSSVLRAPWPVPPTIPEPVSAGTSPLASTTHARTASRTHTPTSSDGGMHGSTTLNSHQPLGTVGVSRISNGSVARSSTVTKPLKSALKRPTVKTQTGISSR